MKTTTTTLFFALLTVCLFAQQLKQKVLFDYNKSALNKSEKIKLDQLVYDISDQLLKKIIISGHTDSDGPDFYNHKLSKQRMLAVKSYLIKNGIESKAIRTGFYGETKPIASNSNPEGMQKNRRVEIIIEFQNNSTSYIGSGESADSNGRNESEDSEMIDPEQAIYGNIFKQFEVPSQTFTINAGKETIITGSQGTKIIIPKKSFETEDGKKVKGNVEIELKEFYNKSEFVLNNLHTISGNKMLESGGMIYISAKSGDNKLRLRKKKKIELEFNNSEDLPDDMEVFVNNGSKRKINWIPDRYSGNSGGMKIILSKGKNTKEYRYAKPFSLKQKKASDGLFTSSKLGWINCDRFNNVTDKTSILVDVNMDFKPTIMLVFKDINSVMPSCSDRKGKIGFANIPAGKEATIVAISMVNDLLFYSIKDIVIQKNDQIDLQMKKTNKEELKELLTELN